MKHSICELRSIMLAAVALGVATLAVGNASAALVAHFRFNDTLNDETGNHNGHMRTEGWEPAFEPGKNGNAIRIDSVDSAVELANPATLDFSQSFTIAAWIKTAATGERIIVYKGNADAWGQGGDPSKQFQMYGGDGFGTAGLFFHSQTSGAFGTSFVESPGIIVNDDNWHHIAFTYNPSRTPTMKLYVDGHGKGPADPGRYANWDGNVNMTTERADAVVRIGTRADREYPNFVGLMDEVQIYNQALDDSQIQYLVDNPSQVVLPPEMPTIFTQPVRSTTVIDGVDVTLKVVAESQTALNYQWKFNGADLPGATSPTLTLSNVTADQTGVYTVNISNTKGSVTSDPASLMVLTGGRPLLDIGVYSGITLHGPAGMATRIDYLEGNQWITLTNVTPAQAPRLVIDPSSAGVVHRIYKPSYIP
ncbi:MAG: immunoglobulin domain-containing protein [Candidatus Omnitrophica bacterium]|nr:immunoglobulin domain-containing protein [Candidatus Omnitrophota bacterium]